MFLFKKKKKKKKSRYLRFQFCHFKYQTKVCHNKGKFQLILIHFNQASGKSVFMNFTSKIVAVSIQSYIHRNTVAKML